MRCGHGPPIFFSTAPKRKRPSTVKRKGAWAAQIDTSVSIWPRNGGVVVGAVQACGLVPGAPDIGKTGIERRRKLRLPTCFRGDRRMGLRYFPRSPLRSALAGQLR